MPSPVKWEYRYERRGSALRDAKDEEIQVLLDEMGEEGWEVVGMAYDGNKILLLAKRPLTLRTRRQRSMPSY
jgi:hypothetical protein